MALNRKTFKKVAGDAPSGNLPSGYFNTVTYTGNGSTQKIGGYINRAALFNGSSSKIEISPSPQDNAGVMSVSFWAKTTNTSRAAFFIAEGPSTAKEFLKLEKPIAYLKLSIRALLYNGR